LAFRLMSTELPRLFRASLTRTIEIRSLLSESSPDSQPPADPTSEEVLSSLSLRVSRRRIHPSEESSEVEAPVAD